MYKRLELGGAARHSAESSGVLLIKHAGHEFGIADQIREFILDIAVVDVDGNSANLETSQHGFEPLVGVLRVDTNMVILDHTTSSKVMPHGVRPVVKFLVSQTTLAVNQGDPIRENVNSVFEQVCDVISHGLKLEHVADPG